jgi:NADPH:quinone reductase-like Zn-dependent oxidoreductase
MNDRDMIAIGVDEFGAPLRPLSLPRPVPGSGEVLVEVSVAAVNPADVGMVAGRYRWAEPVRFPLIPGYDLAGTVMGTGERVAGFTAHSHTQQGSYARYVALPAELVVPVPDALDLIDAATLPLAGMTALQAVEALSLAGVRTLLVNGPRGAVGGFVAQFAASRGVAVVSPGTEPKVDAALDVIGGAAARAAFDAVRDGGRYVTVVPEFWVAGGPFLAQRGIIPQVVFVRHDRAQLAQLLRLAATGELVTRIGKVLPLAEAVEAHRIVGRANGAPRVGGKVLLTLQATA